MAGHSQFKNIMHRKGRQDAVRARLFAKLAREITVAARSGLDDPAFNARLRLAIQNAKAENMPKDNIERAIKKAQAVGGDDYVSIRYEGYGPGGVAVIIEALTDNRRRTAASVRAILAKYQGNLGETNSVSFSFERVGQSVYRGEGDLPSSLGVDEVLEAALEAGADDVVWDGEAHTITCGFEDLPKVSLALEADLGPASSTSVIWKPQTFVDVEDEDVAKALLAMIEALENDEDVQAVFTNFQVCEEILTRLTQG